jgi:hypothetical protein
MITVSVPFTTSPAWWNVHLHIRVIEASSHSSFHSYTLRHTIFFTYYCTQACIQYASILARAQRPGHELCNVWTLELHLQERYTAFRGICRAHSVHQWKSFVAAALRRLEPKRMCEATSYIMGSIVCTNVRNSQSSGARWRHTKESRHLYSIEHLQGKSVVVSSHSDWAAVRKHNFTCSAVHASLRIGDKPHAQNHRSKCVEVSGTWAAALHRPDSCSADLVF